MLQLKETAMRCWIFLALLAGQAMAQASSSGQVVAAGTVPDQATKAAFLARLRELYGNERVLDRIDVGPVAVPPNWSGHLQKLLAPNLQMVSKGQLQIDGNNVSIRGEVANEAQRQQIASDMAASLNPSYTVNNGLRVSAPAQNLLDAALGKRIIEFESGRAVIRPSGLLILDDMAAALQKVQGKKVEVIGHTDNIGARDANLALSQARAAAVRDYLTQKGIAAASIAVAGEGPDRPLADNASAEGRARNRRIEFHVVD
jgi:OOP family OmpA-OmpF porin